MPAEIDIAILCSLSLKANVWVCVCVHFEPSIFMQQHICHSRCFLFQFFNLAFLFYFIRTRLLLLYCYRVDVFVYLYTYAFYSVCFHFWLWYFVCFSFSDLLGTQHTERERESQIRVYKCVIYWFSVIAEAKTCPCDKKNATMIQIKWNIYRNHFFELNSHTHKHIYSTHWI